MKPHLDPVWAPYFRVLIVEFSEHSNVPVTQLSKRCGLHPSTLGNVLSGQIPLSYRMAMKVRRAMVEIAEGVRQGEGSE